MIMLDRGSLGPDLPGQPDQPAKGAAGPDLHHAWPVAALITNEFPVLAGLEVIPVDGGATSTPPSG